MPSPFCTGWAWVAAPASHVTAPAASLQRRTERRRLTSEASEPRTPREKSRVRVQRAKRCVFEGLDYISSFDPLIDLD